MDEDLVLVDENPSMTIVESPSSGPSPPPPQRLPLLSPNRKQSVHGEQYYGIPPPPNSDFRVYSECKGHTQETGCLNIPPSFPEFRPCTIPVQAQQHGCSRKCGPIFFPSNENWTSRQDTIFPMPPKKSNTLPPIPPPEYHLPFRSLGKTQAFGAPPPPPPPPPPPGLDASFSIRSLEDSTISRANVSNPSEFIPVHYSGDSVLDKGQVVRLQPSNRQVLLALHPAQAADFEEIKWVVQYGSTETWYEKPGRLTLRKIATAFESAELPALQEPRLFTLETPRVWASSALTTPTDDDIYDCNAEHRVRGSGACYQCTDEKSEALDSTSLVYCLILTTCHASDFYLHGAHFNGKQIYKMVKCGTREAAAAEAFYASGINGWNVIFSCIFRLGETFDERTGPVERVDELWNLAEANPNENTIRVFY